MMKELRTLWYVCNGCETSRILRDVPVGTLPEGWTYKLQASFIDGYWSSGDISSDFTKVLHYCPACTEKNEIKEVFK